MVQATPDKLRSSYSVMTYHKEGPACGRIPYDSASSVARPCQQSCRDGLRISALTVCCESLDFAGFLRWRRTIYTLFISLDDRIGISKRVTTSLSALAQQLLEYDYQVQGTAYFSYQGEKLTDLRERMESKK